MKPFELRIKLETPMQLGKYLRLDGLLWHTLHLHLGCPYKAKEALNDYLTISESGRYYHASTMFFGFKGLVKSPSGQEYFDNLVGVTRAKVGVMRSGSDLSPENFAPNAKRSGGYTKVLTTGGVYKSRLSNDPAYFSHSVVFHGNGKGEEIADLMGFYLVAVGINANSGSGTIGDVTAKAASTDYSVIDHNGMPARPIPLDDYQALSSAPCVTGDAILVPPFRNQPSVLCALPERVRKIQIN